MLAFSKRTSSADGRHSQCRDCNGHYQRQLLAEKNVQQLAACGTTNDPPVHIARFAIDYAKLPGHWWNQRAAAKLEQSEIARAAWLDGYRACLTDQTL